MSDNSAEVKKLDIDEGNNDVENRTGILYNDIVDQLKGMQRNLVAPLFWVQT